MRKGIVCSAKEKIGVLAFAGVSLFSRNYALAQRRTVYVATELPRKTLVSGSDRNYKVRVYVDNSLNEPNGISETTWAVQIPSSRFDSVFVNVPANPSQSEGDIWFGIPLMNNILDTTQDANGLLDPNGRGTPTGSEYAHWRGFVEEISFKVKPNLSKVGIMPTNSWHVYDPSGIPYLVSNASDLYTIVNQLSPADYVGNPGDIRDNKPDLPDGDVDSYDLAQFESCRSGPRVPYQTGCSNRDLDGDGDVDGDDYGIFQRCYSGNDVPADPNCAN